MGFDVGKDEVLQDFCNLTLTVYTGYRYYWRRSRRNLENVVANAGHGVKLPQKRTITIERDTSIASEILAWNRSYLSLLTND